MRFYVELKRTIDADDVRRAARVRKVLRRGAANAETYEAVVRRRIVRVLSEWSDWQRVTGQSYDLLIDEMVEQLPRDDAELFLQTVTHGFRSKLVTGGLTASLYRVALEGEDEEVHLRLRMFTDPYHEAELATLGAELANLVLAALPDLKLATMVIWQDRRRDAVLQGSIDERRSLRAVARENPVAALLSAISALLLAFLVGVAMLEVYGNRTFVVWRDDGLIWFGRLLGPLASTFIASAALLVFELRRTARRTAFWRVGSRREAGGSR
jgi:hypothetical protein